MEKTCFILDNVEAETLRQWVLEGYKIDWVAQMYEAKFNRPIA